MPTQKNELNFNGTNIYSGIDVHLKSWTVTIMVEGISHKSFNQPASSDVLYNYLVNHYPGGVYHSAYEAGFSGFSTHYKLKELGINSIVVNAADIPTTGKEKLQKEDRRDSRKIARSLQGNELTAIYVPTKNCLSDRSLMRMRSTLVRDLARYKQRVKSFLYTSGIEYPAIFASRTNHWSKRFIEWLQQITFTEPSLRISLDALLSQVIHFRLDLLKINKQIRVLSKTQQYASSVELLRSIPGIGLIISMTILTELETINRFSRVDYLCSYIGLIPTTHGTGEKVSTGRITPRGHKVLRKLIIESSWVAIRTDPAMSKCYLDYCKRMTSNKAIIRIAKKLMSRIKYVLTNNKPYQKCKVI